MPTQIPQNAFKSKEKALEVLAEIKRIGKGEVISVKTVKKSEPPPLLHSLTSLQREANKLYGFSANKTLQIAQKLYEEKKILSYPRTDSQYLANANKNLVKEVLTKLGKEDLIPQVDKVGKRVFNDAKLTDHHALIPLAPPPKDLSDDEKKIYNLVWRKFVGAFMDNYEYEITTVILQVGKHKFGTKGKRDIKLGWKALYKEKQDENKLPKLRKGDEVKLKNATVNRKQTTPPPRYTEGKLLKVMEKLNLGTPATRASILETIKKRGYVSVSKKSLIPTEKAKELVRKLSNSQVISPELTSKWETGLEKIWTKRVGKKGYEFFVEKTKELVKSEIEKLKDLEFVASEQTRTKVFKSQKQRFKTKKVFRRKRRK
jgi:DNA topoisomerase-3